MTRPLVLACGALVSELRSVLSVAGLSDAIDIHYLPANLHNRPAGIVPRIRELLAEHDPHSERRVLLAYADCGTGGGLDRLVTELSNVQRLPGAHCYEFFAGSALFSSLHDEEPGTFYLTDFLARHFEALVWEGLGLDRHPELRGEYFSNYHRLVLLSQSDDQAVVDRARDAATRLGLRFVHRHVGLEAFGSHVVVSLRPSGLESAG